MEGLAFHPATQLLVVAGDGAPPAAAAGASGTATPGRDPTISVWRVRGAPEGEGAAAAPDLQLQAASGVAGGPGVLGWAVAGLLGEGSGPGSSRRPWQLAVSPLGEHVAFVTHWGR